MANVRVGLTYIREDTDKYRDSKIRRLRNKFGSDGCSVYDYLLLEIYREHGCYLILDEDAVLDIAEYWRLTETKIHEIIDYCCEIELFDNEQKRKGILTGKSIQRRYLEMSTAAKRRNTEIPEHILLVETSVSLPQTSVSLSQTSVSLSQNDGSLIAPLKEKKSKVKNTPNGVFAQSDCESLQADAPQPEQECALTDFVIPLAGESKFVVPRTDYEKWKTLFPGVDIDQAFRSMIGWCDANPQRKKTLRGVRAFIVRWLDREQNSGKGTRGQPATAKAPSWARGQFDESKYEKPYQPPDPSIYE